VKVPVEPKNWGEKADLALAELVECVGKNFTGSLQFDFSDGIPQLRRRTDTMKFGRIKPKRW
jgi:hypothetical protein